MTFRIRRAELKLQLKARIAKILFHDEGLYSVFNDDDPAVESVAGVAERGAGGEAVTADSGEI